MIREYIRINPIIEATMMIFVIKIPPTATDD
jgi:hypothetical protein